LKLEPRHTLPEPKSTPRGSVSGGVDHRRNGIQAGPVDPADSLLLALADTLGDVEHTRIANENRLRALVGGWEYGGKGVPEGDLAVVRLGEVVAGLAELERSITRDLERAMKAHPLGPWVKRSRGLGMKQVARLLAAIGDPVWNYAEDRPRRGPAELWAYCGYVPGQRRERGVRSNWNAAAKSRAYLCAESCVKAGGPYRDVYDDGRDRYAEAVHESECVRCGPAGRPAPAGSPLSKGHQHARALRLVAKAILRDLFLEARALGHKEDEFHGNIAEGA
jgi:hypothetical protein